MDIYEKESGLFDNQGNIQFLHEIYYYIKGKYYLRCHQTDSAEHYFRNIDGVVDTEVGFANGAGVPFVISQGSMKAGKTAASTVMPLVSAALYLSQFVSPFLMTGASAVLGNFRHPAYLFGMVLSILFLLWSLTIKVIVPKPLELAAELEEQKTASHS